MMAYLREGWATTRKHSLFILFMFMYQLVWGVLLYSLVESVVLPLMRRYPGNDLTNASVQIFLAESQFQLAKTDLASSYLWLLLALFLTRMLITPLVNAGLYYSIHHDEPNRLRSFLQGIRSKGRSFCLLYGCQMLLTLAPLYWVLPRMMSSVAWHLPLEAMLGGLLPALGGYLLYGYLIHLLFIYIQFGKVAGTGLLFPVGLIARYLLPIVGLSLLLLALSGVAAVLSVAASMIWAGLVAVVLHQLYHLVNTVFKVWEIAAQHRYWLSKL